MSSGSLVQNSPSRHGRVYYILEWSSSSVVCFGKIATLVISHWPEAAARDFPTGTSLSLSRAGGSVIAVLSLGVQQIMSFLIHSHSPFIVCTSRGYEMRSPVVPGALRR